MNEEDNLIKSVGKTNPFRVPDGYFEHLTSEVMSRLPEKEKPVYATRPSTKWERMRPWLYMAAMFVGAALIIRVASTRLSPGDVTAMDDAEIETVSDEYIGSIVEESMLDDYSLYVYLSTAE
ncbi:MAG: hypothetical protein LBM06_08775 [Prevotellaceae bacterium]|jgi:hypothetical protein|nr:hypothetical protein [Prevotellaceae bacterium]